MKKRILVRATIAIFMLAMVLGIDVSGQQYSYASAVGDASTKAEVFYPSEEFKQYLKEEIPFDDPTSVPDDVMSFKETQEYVLKCGMEMQEQCVFYGEYGLAEEILDSLAYSPSYGSTFSHVSDWQIKKELVNDNKDIYRHTIKFSYRETKEQARLTEKRITEVKAFLESKLEKMPDVKGAETNSEEYKKVRLIYDYILKTVRAHDYWAATDDVCYNSHGYKTEVHTLASAVLDGETVCQGYAMYFERLSERMGLEARYVAGAVKTIDAADKNYFNNEVKKLEDGAADSYRKRWAGLNHAWNQVKIDGNWYNLDVTWDAELTDLNKSSYYYNYFLKSDDEFGKPEIEYVYEDISSYSYKKVPIGTVRVWHVANAEEAPKSFEHGFLYSKYATPNLSITYLAKHPLGNPRDFAEGKYMPVFQENEVSIPSSARYELSIPTFNQNMEIPVGGMYDDEIIRKAKIAGYYIKDGVWRNQNVEVINIDELYDSFKEPGTFVMQLRVGDVEKEYTIHIKRREDMTKPKAVLEFKKSSVGISQIFEKRVFNAEDANANRKLREAFFKDLELKIRENVIAYEMEGTEKLYITDIKIEGLEKINPKYVEWFDVVVSVKGSDGLKVKKTLEVSVTKGQRPNTGKIEVGKQAFEITEGTTYTGDFREFIKREADVWAYSEESGIIIQQPMTIYLLSESGKEKYEPAGDDGEKMRNLLRSPGEYNFEIRIQPMGDQTPTVATVKMTVKAKEPEKREQIIYEVKHLMTDGTSIYSYPINKIWFTTDTVVERAYNLEYKGLKAVGDTVKTLTLHKDQDNTITFVYERIEN